MVVGEYSIFSAILRMETFSYPSLTNRSRAASSITCRNVSFSRSRLCLGPILSSRFNLSFNLTLLSILRNNFVSSIFPDQSRARYVACSTFFQFGSVRLLWRHFNSSAQQAQSQDLSMFLKLAAAARLLIADCSRASKS